MRQLYITFYLSFYLFQIEISLIFKDNVKDIPRIRKFSFPNRTHLKTSRNNLILYTNCVTFLSISVFLLKVLVQNECIEISFSTLWHQFN
jgi:hypothetical protein